MFLDFAKAFDTINHNILLQKLNAYGVRGIVHDWFKSYLTDRKQMVKLGNIFSESKTIMCGVPQGSVLGQLLFLIYVNDIYISTNKLDFDLFADDTALYLSDKDIYNLEEKINTERLKITEWLEINKLTLNVSKSNFVIFSVPQKKAVDIKIYLCNKQLEKKDYVKHLSWRVMCFKEAQENSIPLFKKLGLMNFKQLFLFEILKFTWKANQNELPNFFNSIFPHLTINDNTRISTRNIRLTKNYFPISRTSYKSCFTGSICSSSWIKLPQEFKLINNLSLYF